MIELRKAARIVGRAKDCVRCSLAKAMLPLKEMNFVLYFDLRPEQICHYKVLHRKEVTHSNGQ